MARELAVNQQVPACDVAIEEEFHLVDAHTRRLSAGAAKVLTDLPDDGRFKPELLDSAVEINSGIHATLAGLRADLAGSRALLVAAAAAHGLMPVAAGTVPLADPRVSQVVPDPRMERMRADFALVADEQIICSTQVQVDCADRETGVVALGRMQRWLPGLVALTASSPYWCGDDTGYSSYRSLVWRRWPTSGPAPQVSSAAEYDSTVEALLRTGTVYDRGMLYFDVRPSQTYPTLEVRLCDAVPRLDDVLLLAGLARALVETTMAEVASGRPEPGGEPPRELLEAARWRAARSGVDDTLLDPLTFEPVPAAEAIATTLAHLGPALEARGDADHVRELADAVLSSGNSARRQRRVVERGGTLPDVVDLLARETRGGRGAVDVRRTPVAATAATAAEVVP